MGRKKPATRDEESAPTTGAGAGKSKKKGFVITDDEYFMGTELSEEAVVPEEKVAATQGNKKKGKKGGSKNMVLNDDDEDEGDNVIADAEDEEEDDAPAIKFGGKKKAKAKKSGNNSGFSASAFGMLGEDDDENDVESKEKDDEDEDLGVPEISFSGKKKPSKSKKSGGNISSAFELLDEEEESGDKDESSKEEDEDVGITFTGKKKKSSKGSKKTSFSSALIEEENDDGASVSKVEDDLGEGGVGDQEEEAFAVKFSGKKKSSKKKNINDDTAAGTGIGDTPSDIVEPDEHGGDSKDKKPNSEDVTSKNKKKKKKGGKNLQEEEEDLDKILAELGAGPPVTKPVQDSAAAPAAPPPEEKLQNQPVEQEEAEEEGPAETATSKKKKKKKKASVPAAEEKPEETKNEKNSKVTGKKVPKHVREMQEALAKQREAEERKKREEEEKLRKEEEERRKQEELERLAEEKKRLKKEREKEKLLKKKQEGKLLTGKQKEEARRLEAMRKQILANAKLDLPTGEASGAHAKRPLYQKKKSKPQNQSNGAAISENGESTDSKEIQQDAVSELDSVEAENVEEVESPSAQVKAEVTDVVEDNGVDEEEEEEDDDEEWDAKSWDDADLKLPGKSVFADEEVDSEPEPLPKKDMKNTRTAPQDAELHTSKPIGLAEKVTSVMPQKSENVDVQKNSVAEGNEKNNKKNSSNPDKRSKKEVSDDQPVQDGQNLRSPICCIMGHVDTGKTKLLDCIRGTNVQEGEAGGITQQIGATYFPAENIRERTKELKADAKLNVPGLLVIDTPGHESFTNLRSRGSGLCDLAILVVDIMHGLEPQTIESLNLLKMRNTDFLIALNKVDRLYGWKTCRNAPIGKAIRQQSKDVMIEFNMRLTQIITQFKEQGLNTELYYKNKEMGETYNIVPTSAISGEGIPDLLLLLVQWAQKTMIKRLTYSEEVQCTVLEVKVVEGHGTTIDVVLVNGVLHEGDQIVVCGMQGPVVTSIRALLTPHPMRELRVKGTYLHHKEIKAAQGIKIAAQGLEHAIAGTSLYVVGPNDDIEDIKESAMDDVNSVMSRIDKSGEGVYVQASTLGSLEALLEFLKTPAVNIPVSAISIGPVHKKDVMKASVMLEKKKEYGTILAFDVKVTPEARELADELGVKIFIADIIYHLFDQFKAYIDNLKEEKKREAADEAVFPCVLKIMPNCVFNKKDPIVLGVDVVEGIAKIGTPICVPGREFVEIGRVASIENNHKPVDYAKKGQKVAIKIIGSNPEEQQKMFGRHFEMEDELVSKISRKSLDALKENYADDLSTEEKRLLFKLKKLFKIL
ncbi:eukaryotic translation initiation factor 5B-like [Salvia miltiorrhiza]|uniref:eukaryotic translation initiation factor 5B-like n=1 Tax=Salvia miltiorrhiza TaxID=226208 RepID=UPI0025ABA961|nr:eukaryotic translation initiation factor 5B-like [Salvia miltiorrhiza]